MIFNTAVAQILGARSAVELFGVDNQIRAYRTLAKVVHPDHAPSEHTAQATAAFARLSELWTSIKTVTVKDYQVQTHFGHDDLADWFLAKNAADASVLLKINNRPVNNDLMRREADNLKKIYLGLDARHEAFFPALVDSFPYRDEETDADRVVNVFTDDVKFYSLRTISEIFSGGLDGRHVAWIWRRVLVALGAAHLEGVIHGAVTPDSILINPSLHGLRLSNWCLSAHGSQRIPAVAKRYRNWYHDDVAAKRQPEPHTDIYLATKVMMSLFDPGTFLPTPLFAFAEKCLAIGPEFHKKYTPAAFALLNELDTVLETVYGPRTFTRFPDLPVSALIWPQG